MIDRLNILLVFLLMLFIARDIMSMDYVPDKELIENRFQEFLSKPTHIEGIYGNYDVDSVIFKYTSEDDNVLDTIQRQASKLEWRVYKSHYPTLQLFRKYPPKGKDDAGLYSYELVKVHYNREFQHVCVGWLQIDETHDVLNPQETGEGKWALSNLWPVFDRCCEGSNLSLQTDGINSSFCFLLVSSHGQASATGQPRR